ncbi:MAG: flagellar hook-length control protein FliK [Pseudomonadota bacterium]
MQSPPLPVQLTSAAPAPAAPRNQSGNADGGAQFSQALSREMHQQQGAPAKPQAPAKANPPAKAAAPQPAAKPAQQDKAAEPAAPAKAAASDEATSASAVAEDAADGAVATDPAATNPLLDLMAMVASFNQPAPVSAVGQAIAAAVAAAAAASSDRLPGAAALPALAELPAAAQGGGARLLAPALPAGPAGAAVPVAAQGPETAFSNMMGKVDGAMQAGLEAAAAALAQPRSAPSAAAQGVPQERAPLEQTLRTDAKPAVQPNLAAPAVAVVRDVLPEPLAAKEVPLAAVAATPLQAAAFAPLQGSSAADAADRIAARVGTPAWDNQVAQKIVWMVAGKEQSATLTLNPPDMGPMQVVLSVTNDQATVTFAAAQPEVRQALLDAMPKLREMMGENGIALGNASVHDGSSGQQQAQGEAQGRNGGAPGQGPSGSAAEAEARVAARPPRTGESPGLVDTFA